MAAMLKIHVAITFFCRAILKELNYHISCLYHNLNDSAKKWHLSAPLYRMSAPSLLLSMEQSYKRIATIKLIKNICDNNYLTENVSKYIPICGRSKTMI